VVEDGDVSSDEAVDDVSSAVYVGSLHDDAVLYLPDLYDAEALDADSPHHLAEVGLRGRLVPVSARLSEVGVPLEAFDEVLHVGYLEELA